MNKTRKKPRLEGPTTSVVPTQSNPLELLDRITARHLLEIGMAWTNLQRKIRWSWVGIRSAVALLAIDLWNSKQPLRFCPSTVVQIIVPDELSFVMKAS
jgi:hypothetical protein